MAIPSQLTQSMSEQQISDVQNHVEEKRDAGEYSSSGGGAASFIVVSVEDGDKDDEDEVIGFGSSGYDLMLGFDYLMSDRLVPGGALNVSEKETDFNSKLGDQEISLVSLSTFGNFYASENIYFDWLLAYSF
ncbi:MAG: outer membrane lipase/esterase [Cellvibrionaceae bacterium]|jgi:outer membrane lipase/esterase